MGPVTSVTQEVDPKVQMIVEEISKILKNRDILQIKVGPKTTIGHFLFNDKKGEWLDKLSNQLGLALNYSITIFAAADALEDLPKPKSRRKR